MYVFLLQKYIRAIQDNILVAIVLKALLIKMFKCSINLAELRPLNEKRKLSYNDKIVSRR